MNGWDAVEPIGFWPAAARAASCCRMISARSAVSCACCASSSACCARSSSRLDSTKAAFSSDWASSTSSSARRSAARWRAVSAATTLASASSLRALIRSRTAARRTWRLRLTPLICSSSRRDWVWVRRAVSARADCATSFTAVLDAKSMEDFVAQSALADTALRTQTQSLRDEVLHALRIQDCREGRRAHVAPVGLARHPPDRHLDLLGASGVCRDLRGDGLLLRLRRGEAFGDDRGLPLQAGQLLLGEPEILPGLRDDGLDALELGLRLDDRGVGVLELLPEARQGGVGRGLLRLGARALVVQVVRAGGQPEREPEGGCQDRRQEADHTGPGRRALLRHRHRPHTLVYRLNVTTLDTAASPIATATRAGATVQTASVPMKATKRTDCASQSWTRYFTPNHRPATERPAPRVAAIAPSSMNGSWMNRFDEPTRRM